MNFLDIFLKKATNDCWKQIVISISFWQLLVHEEQNNETKIYWNLTENKSFHAYFFHNLCLSDAEKTMGLVELFLNFRDSSFCWI